MYICIYINNIISIAVKILDEKMKLVFFGPGSQLPNNGMVISH